MNITESMLEATRRRFGDSDNALPVRGLSELYNEATYGILPLFDERLSKEHWMQYAAENGFRPTGASFFDTLKWSAGGPKFKLLLAFTDRIPRLPDRYEWRAVIHFHGGVRLNSLLAIALELEPKSEVKDALWAITERWHFSGLCDPQAVLSEYRAAAEARIAEYRTQLANLGVEWTGSSPAPEDALYPIDATQEALDKLAIKPPQLWAIARASAEGKQMPAEGRRINPVILLLAENSD